MKARLIPLLCVCLLLSLLASCANSPDSQSKSEGIQLYNLSESERKLLTYLAYEDDVTLFSFKAPKTVKSLEVNTYVLGPDQNWEQNGGGKISLDATQDEALPGMLSLILKENHSLAFHITTTGRASYQTDEISDHSLHSSSTKTFLTEFEAIEPGKEIPVAILVCDSGTVMRTFDVNSFFSPDNYKDMDLVQAVTLTFTAE